MKMSLTAPAIAKLVELDPDGTVELAKGAAMQLAGQIAKRMTRDAIQASISRFLEGELQEGNWYQKNIAAKYRKLLADALQALARDFITSLSDGAINELVQVRVDEVMAARRAEIDKMLTQRAEQILRERFAAMFAAKEPATTE